MKPFDYSRPGVLERAIHELSTMPESKVLAGGTDLLREIRSGSAMPARLVSLAEIADLDEIKSALDGGLKVGARVTLAAIAEHPVIRQRYAALAEACMGAATPQIRNVATLAGNVLQRPNCEYYRGDFDCPLKPGADRNDPACPAKGGDTTHHAVFGGGFCVSGHPSDAAAALAALEARVTWRDPRGEHTAPVSALHRLPDAGHLSEIALAPDGIITAFHLPPFIGRSAYRQARERSTWAFALVGVAARLNVLNGRVTEAGLALTGVAPVPWRLANVERRLHDVTIQGTGWAFEIARLAVADARPLLNNVYKVRLIEGLVRRVLLDISGKGEATA